MEVSISKSEGIKNNNLSSIEAKDNYNLRAAMIHVVGKYLFRLITSFDKLIYKEFIEYLFMVYIQGDII